MFIYQWIIVIPLLFVVTAFCSLMTVIGGALKSDKMIFAFSSLWGRMWCYLMFVKVEVRGRENIDSNTSYVFVANHQSSYDIYSIYGFLNHDFRWMMKKSLEKVPFIGWSCKRVGHIFVDKSSARAIIQTMAEAREKLKDGRSLTVFPEGARTHDGFMQPFKSGAFKLATDFHLPIVPLTISGAYEVMPRSTFQITPGKIVLTIHKPIPPARNAAEREIVKQKCFDDIQSALPEKYKKK